MVNIHEAKTTLSALLADVVAGHEIIIAKAGKPIARLVPMEVSAKRPIGLYDGVITISDDFDSSIPVEFEPYTR